MQRSDATKLTKKLGKRLVVIRGDQSQEAFAKKLGVSRGYLSDLERGAREMSLATLAVVCKKTGATPNDLLA